MKRTAPAGCGIRPIPENSRGKFTNLWQRAKRRQPHFVFDFIYGGARHEAETQGVPFLGEAPLHMLIRETSDGGRPVVATAPDSPQARAYIDIAAKVRAALDGGTQRAAPRIVIS